MGNRRDFRTHCLDSVKADKTASDAKASSSTKESSSSTKKKEKKSPAGKQTAA